MPTIPIHLENLREVTEVTQGCFSQLGLSGLAKHRFIKELAFTKSFLLFSNLFLLFLLFSSSVTCAFFFQTLNLNIEFGYIAFF